METAPSCTSRNEIENPPKILLRKNNRPIDLCNLVSFDFHEDIVGSLEFASGVMNTQLVVVLGHTDCGAVKAAIDKDSVPTNFQKLRKLIQKILIKPSNTLDQNIIENVLGKLTFCDFPLLKCKTHSPN